MPFERNSNPEAAKLLIHH